MIFKRNIFWTLPIRLQMKHFKLLYVFLCLALLLSGCAGEDYTPVYFQPAGDGSREPTPEASDSAETICTVTFTSQLCIAIKGKEIDVGTDEANPLCVEVPPFPIHVNGTEVILLGSEFPDIEVEGNELPIALTFNARGTGTGDDNVGKGVLEGDGNITINDFSFFINAIGMSAEVPGLTLTTKEAVTTEFLPTLVGSAPDTSGAMVLVTSTTLGHTFDAADAILMGSSLGISFSGGINPTLDACQGSGDELLEVTKIVTDNDGHIAEVGLAGGKRLEVSINTYIAEDSSDVGPQFEGNAKFRIRNTSSEHVAVKIPPKLSAFHISSLEPLTQTLPPKKSLTISISFRPKTGEVEPGNVEEQLMLGTQVYTIVGVALFQKGKLSIDAVDDRGETTAPSVDGVDLGNSEVPVKVRRDYFICKNIICEEQERISECNKCDSSENSCSLYPINIGGFALGEVDDNCKQLRPDEIPLYTINISGNGNAVVIAKKQVLALRNKGVRPIIIKDIKIENSNGSSSSGEFYILPGAIFVANDFGEVQKQLIAALSDGNYQGIEFPFTLPPFQSGYNEMSAYIVITYQPHDLVGSDGKPASTGSEAIDKAIIKIITEDGEETTASISGSTIIRETPPLEILFKTSTGIWSISEGHAFPFRSLTGDTVDVAYPLYLRPSDGATSNLRIVSVAIEGKDADWFEWLNTSEKIQSRIPESGKGIRCSEPSFDPSTGEMVDENFELQPVNLGGNGYDLAPGAYTDETAPLFGCINFHRTSGNKFEKRLYETKVIVTALELDPSGLPQRNPDGSLRQLVMPIRLLAAIEPIKGKLVLRIAQTSAVILHPQFPALSAIPAYVEMADKNNAVDQSRLQIFLGSVILDPFDEETITSSDGTKVLSEPGDGYTMLFRAIDTHPISTNYLEPELYDYSSLLHDGEAGIFADYPNRPPDLKANGWRIFTGSLSYPGPLSTSTFIPDDPTECKVIDPCDPDDMKTFTEAGVKPGEKGACAFFYASGARYDSPAFHKAENMEGGIYQHLCEQQNEPQALLDVDTAKYDVDGHFTVEEVGLRFFGPNAIHNLYGALSSVPPLDEIFHMSFTTGTLRPQKNPDELNPLPDERINLSSNEFKMNLTDPKGANPGICDKNTNNRTINGKKYSSWKYLAPLLSQDEEGKIPSGCPTDDNDFKGGVAFLHGRPIDHETGILSIVTGAKFSSNRDLTFAFQDIMFFVILNGWVCDPLGDESNFEGTKCYDMEFNERDAKSQISVFD